jgi:aminoglycoside phosphotransferase family enzyme
MDLSRLIEALSRPSAYARDVDAVEVHQTPISVVFLAGSLAYKRKKPVSLGFVDYSTQERRRHFCEEEVRPNRRVAPEVYLGVVPVTRDGEAIRVERAGEMLECAVKMRRFAC